MKASNMAEEPRARLGRGLAALIGDAGQEGPALARARGQKKVPIEFLRPNPRNPRKSFADADLEDLTQSIREKGIIQPILARTLPGVADAYEIIAGERRWRAAQKAGLHDVPILVVEADDKQSLELAIIENVQRTDLNPLEEALGYERLESEFKYSQTELAKVIGKSRSHVANTLRLLKLPEKAKRLLAEGALSAGHARALLTMAEADFDRRTHCCARPFGSRRRKAGAEGSKCRSKTGAKSRRGARLEKCRYARPRKFSRPSFGPFRHDQHGP